MLLDANLLLYATDRSSPHHERSAAWLTSVLRGDRRVGIPWQSLGAFLHIGSRLWGQSGEHSSNRSCRTVFFTLEYSALRSRRSLDR